MHSCIQLTNLSCTFGAPQIPIYHPTTTLLLVAYTEPSRGKPLVLGKLQYRISNLMVINSR